jgi:mono/diheme cytochrome c family protein
MWKALVAAAVLPLLAATVKAEIGAEVYAKNCAACHRPDGVGTPGLAPPLVSDILKKAGQVNHSYVAQVVLNGLSGPIKVNGQQFMSAMPLRPDLSDSDVAAVANYVMQDLNGLSAADYAPLTADDIAELRKTPMKHPALREMRSKFGD